MAEDNNRKPIGVRRRKDDLMTAIWHKRHAPFGVILSINPAVVLPSRKDHDACLVISSKIRRTDKAARGTALQPGRSDAAASI